MLVSCKVALGVLHRVHLDTPPNVLEFCAWDVLTNLVLLTGPHSNTSAGGDSCGGIDAPRSIFLRLVVGWWFCCKRYFYWGLK